jgi:hypothetical protein
VGGAAPLLSEIGRGRAFALALLLAALGIYCAVAERLWGLPSGLDVTFHSLVVFPTFAAAIWLALPFARVRSSYLLTAAAAVGLAAALLTVIGVGSMANVGKLVCFTLLGFWFLSLFEELWWTSLVAVLVPWVDIWSVVAGPTRYVVEEQPGFFERISVAFPNPGETETVNIGPPDVIFFALFLATAARFRIRVAWTWLAMTAFLSLTLVLIWTWEDISGLPALPAVCLGFLVPNADLLWRDARDALVQRRRGNVTH